MFTPVTESQFEYYKASFPFELEEGILKVIPHIQALYNPKGNKDIVLGYYQIEYKPHAVKSGFAIRNVCTCNPLTSG